ncbi:serine hydrolase [Algoriphagus sediminis]|uniref:Serine hydrolase n=1 Tax=Algoriphagus sediminis TaxID=3057113 RepID=A0ABT7YB67_9BACT|nr:serine hydrolase [Algoriphagus sediminis]MDN3203761.1 serine hydrolase [Algoriphagus sediminis]
MKKLLIASLLLFGFACTENDENKEEELAQKISRIENGLQPNLQIEGDSIPRFNIKSRLKELGIPGVSIAVIYNGEIEWAKGYGIADSSENRKVTSKTMFLAGSISKPVAALRAHQLAEQGIIHLDSNVNNYLKSWKLPENEFTQKEKVTTRRILNHTAGLTVWGFPGYDKGDTVPTVPQVLDGEGNTDSVRVYKEPGESWMYSGGGYTIMQLMITDLESSDFPEIMQENVLNPIGMTGSTFANPLPDEFHSIAATGYRSNGAEVEGKWPIYPEMAAAGLWTTPSELILYAKEIQNIYQNKENGILKVSTVEEMLTPGLENHGLGPGVNEFTFGHGGADEGFRANLVAWKDQPVAVVIMVNSDNGSIIQEILLSIVEEYGLPGITPNKKKVVQLTEDERNRFVGTYKFEDFGEVYITLKENGLNIEGNVLDKPALLLPTSETSFFDKNDGTTFEFNLESEKVTGLEVQGFSAEKIK